MKMAAAESARKKVESSAVTPPHEIDPAEDLVVAEEALKVLRPADAEVVVLRFLGGFSYAEIAGKVGGTEDSVRMRVQRSLQRLRNVSVSALLATEPVREILPNRLEEHLAEIRPRGSRLPTGLILFGAGALVLVGSVIAIERSWISASVRPGGQDASASTASPLGVKAPSGGNRVDPLPFPVKLVYSVHMSSVDRGSTLWDAQDFRVNYLTDGARYAYVAEYAAKGSKPRHKQAYVFDGSVVWRVDPNGQPNSQSETFGGEALMMPGRSVWPLTIGNTFKDAAFEELGLRQLTTLKEWKSHVPPGGVPVLASWWNSADTSRDFTLPAVQIFKEGQLQRLDIGVGQIWQQSWLFSDYKHIAGQTVATHVRIERAGTVEMSTVRESLYRKAVPVDFVDFELRGLSFQQPRADAFNPRTYVDGKYVVE